MVHHMIIQQEKFQSEKIEGLTAEFANLQSLNLSSVGLTSLDGLPNLNNLRSIDLSGFKQQSSQ